MHVIDYLIKHEWTRRVRAHCQAFFVTQAGLFQVNIIVSHRISNTNRLVLGPTCIGIRDQDISGLQFPKFWIRPTLTLASLT